MDVHKNARLMPKGRELMIERLRREESPIDVAGAVGVSVRTVYKWHKPYGGRGCGDLFGRDPCVVTGQPLARLLRWRSGRRSKCSPHSRVVMIMNHMVLLMFQ